MLLIAYLGQIATTMVRSISKYSVRLQQFFGVLILLLAIAMYFQFDTKIQAAIVQYFPSTNLENSLIANNGNPIIPKNNKPMPADSVPLYNAAQGEIQNTKGTTMEKIDFKNLGKAPEFTGINGWINSDPLKMSDLKGKVVLVDFWTYSCINCIRTLPYVTKWYDTYKDKGFVVIGVHTPEFPFEKVADNVRTAAKRFDIHYPVAQDNDYATWNAYQNQYWPAEYLIDKNGNIVYTHFGEGNYDHTENAIRQLLGLDGDPTAKTSTLGNIGSPEMYFGTSRLQYLSPAQSASEQVKNYTFPSKLDLNNFAIEGSWQFSAENAKLTLGKGKIKLHFSSGKLFMVAQSSTKPAVLKITVDGKVQPDVTVDKSELYTLFDSNDYVDHEIEISIDQPGFEAFTFTFG
jgi:thiol-disulfide isomerase/thioredoxin